MCVQTLKFLKNLGNHVVKINGDTVEGGNLFIKMKLISSNNKDDWSVTSHTWYCVLIWGKMNLKIVINWYWRKGNNCWPAEPKIILW